VDTTDRELKTGLGRPGLLSFGIASCFSSFARHGCKLEVGGWLEAERKRSRRERESADTVVVHDIGDNLDVQVRECE
jgi:hypothetical protein